MSYKIILMDGSAFLFRAYFSTLSQNLTNHDGFPTGAMFGVIGAIKRLQNQYPEAKIITIFDHKGKNFRHDIYPEYKILIYKICHPFDVLMFLLILQGYLKLMVLILKVFLII